MIRLLTCDDSREARQLVRTLLSGHPEIEIVGEAQDGQVAVALAAELEPDVVLMDIAMPELDGIAATKRILEERPGTRVVALTGVDDAESVQRMLEAGASSYCVKGGPLWELERAIAGASQPLLRLAHGLARSFSERGVAGLVARETAELTGASVVAVYLATDPGLEIAALAGAAAPPAEELPMRAAPELAHRSHAESRSLFATSRELVDVYRTFGVPCSAAFAAPLVANGENLGVLVAVMPANIQFELDVEMVRAIADVASGALASERRLAATHAEARRDALTGLGNRRAFDEHLDFALDDAAVHGRDLSLVLLDLDDFKETNDTRGHAEGDRVLAAFGRILLASTRADEEVFRIGGDEFAVVVRGDADAAAAAADRMRRAVASQQRIEGLPTVSAGVAPFRPHEGSKDDLVRQADTALYAAKGAGKDRTAVFHERHAASREAAKPLPAPLPPELALPESHGIRLLVVDDDPSLRMLLRTTFEIIDIAVEEAASAGEAEALIAAQPPDAIVLDVVMPDVDGIALCRRLKSDPTTAEIPIVLLTGAEGATEEEGSEAGADAFLRKPFSPIELLSTIESLLGRLPEGPFRLLADERPEEQLILYAQDLRRLLELERSQRLFIQTAYEETVTALARALESKDVGTGAHSQRVTQYARQLAHEFDPELLRDPSLDYGFLLHDIGKIGIPDSVLLKSGPLNDVERRTIESHTVLGEQIMQRVPILQGEGLKVIRSHHERWDGRGYPDRLRDEGIPVGARIFSVADALDAMTTDRPYRRRRPWEDAAREILSGAGTQFDPRVVGAFERCEPRLRRTYYELGAA